MHFLMKTKIFVKLTLKVIMLYENFVHLLELGAELVNICNKMLYKIV